MSKKKIIIEESGNGKIIFNGEFSIEDTLAILLDCARNVAKEIADKHKCSDYRCHEIAMANAYREAIMQVTEDHHKSHE